MGDPCEIVTQNRGSLVTTQRPIILSYITVLYMYLYILTTKPKQTRMTQ